MCEKQLGIAAITQQLHKFSGFIKSGELQTVPHTWLQVGNLSEPHGVGNRPLGDGKMGVQESDLQTRRIFDSMSPQYLWMLASMDVNMWSSKQINKPDGDPYDLIGKIARGMLETDNKRLGISNILTTRIYGEKERRVGWRDAFIYLSPALITLMADTDKLIRTVERGDIATDFVTKESSGGLRWDRLVFESLKIGNKNQDKLTVCAGGVKVVVSDIDTAIAASVLVNPFLRSVAPGLKEAAYLSALQRI